jgi:hypothetical protein
MPLEKFSTRSAANQSHTAKALDDKIVEITQSLTFLMSESKKTGLNHISNILMVARDDVVQWAVEANFYKDGVRQDLVKEAIFDSSVVLAFRIVSRLISIEDLEMREKVMGIFKELFDASDISTRDVGAAYVKPAS